MLDPKAYLYNDTGLMALSVVVDVVLVLQGITKSEGGLRPFGQSVAFSLAPVTPTYHLDSQRCKNLEALLLLRERTALPATDMLTPAVPVLIDFVDYLPYGRTFHNRVGVQRQCSRCLQTYHLRSRRQLI